MARECIGSDYSEIMSDATTCTCTTGSIDKCSLKNCTMFHEPFFLHPPTTRPRDGIYINPMNPFITETPKPKDTESFYLHSPHETHLHAYTRIARLFCENIIEKPRNSDRNGFELKDETLTVKVDVHINNGNFKTLNNGNSIRSDIIKDTDHAYEQICIRPEDTESVKSIGNNKKHQDDAASESSRSRTTGRRFSRSSSGSESSSQLSSEIQYSSPTSTPSLSRISSNEHIGKVSKPPELPERNSVTPENPKSPANSASIANPPPPPPPPPPPDSDELTKTYDMIDKKDNNMMKDNKSESGSTATNKSDVSCSEHQAEVVAAVSASTTETTEETKQCQVTHLVHKHMVLPFIPPKFTNADSETLLKPSEYLKSICKGSGKNTLSKARSVDNLDIQRVEEEEVTECEKQHTSPPGPPPPPLPPQLLTRSTSISTSTASVSAIQEQSEISRTPQPLATISIQDLTSVQLRRTNIKMNATKTFSAPPPRSVSMTNVSEPFFVQKTDVIAELKMAKDIPGIKKIKVEMAKVEKTQEQNLISEISKSFSVSNFVDQIPEKDSTGNVIPIWKRQMMARKAAERAKKEMEEQIARENEEKRQKAIPPWKRQLLAKKETTNISCEEKEIKKPTPSVLPAAPPPVKIDLVPVQKRDGPAVASTAQARPKEVKVEEEKKQPVAASRDNDSDEDAPIIPWRAQLRKTNSKLNILD